MGTFIAKPPGSHWIALDAALPPVGERVIFKTGSSETEGVCDWGIRQADGMYKMENTLNEPFLFTHWAHFPGKK